MACLSFIRFTIYKKSNTNKSVNTGFYPGTPFYLTAQGVDNTYTKERQTATASKKLETYKPFKLRLQNCNKSNCSKNKKSFT